MRRWFPFDGNNEADKERSEDWVSLIPTFPFAMGRSMVYFPEYPLHDYGFDVFYFKLRLRRICWH